MIKASGLSKAYDKKSFLSGISFELAKGQALALAGGNGAGKTTLLSLLATAYAPDSGSLFIGGIDALRDKAAARELIGYVPQSLALMPELSVRDNLLYWMKKKDMRVCQQVLEFIGLSDVQRKRTSKLSGGMQRRLNLGAALVLRAPVLILDEPLAGVDAQNRRRIIEGLCWLKQSGSAIVFASHDLEELSALADQLLVLREGQSAYYGVPDKHWGIGALAETIQRNFA